MEQYLPWALTLVSIIIIVLVLLQQRGTALGSAFGQDGGFYAARRGLQNNIFWATIIFGVLFLTLALLNLLF